MFRRLLRRLPIRIKPASHTLSVVRVTPDPLQAAELERRFRALNYRPEVGFHRDRTQPRVDAPITRRG